MATPLTKEQRALATEPPAEQKIIVDGIIAGIAPVIGDLRARLADVERRLAETEAKGLDYRGTYQRAETYRRGSVVTHDGSAWVALEETRAAPSTAGSWQLMVKRGRDGRDSK